MVVRKQRMKCTLKLLSVYLQEDWRKIKTAKKMSEAVWKERIEKRDEILLMENSVTIKLIVESFDKKYGRQ